VRKKTYPATARLYGVHEAAEYLNLSRKNLTAILARGNMVEPLARLKCGPIWSESQLDEQRFAWRDNPRTKLDPRTAEIRAINRRLAAIDRRWQALIEIAVDTSRRSDIHAVWRGENRVERVRRNKRAVASPTEARRAVAEAKLLRMVSNLRDKDEVFRGIADELDEAVDLRKRLNAITDTPSRNGSEKVGVQS